MSNKISLLKTKFKLFCRIQRKDQSFPFTRKRDHKPENFTVFTEKFLNFGVLI